MISDPPECDFAGFAVAVVADAERLRAVVRLVLHVLDAAHEQPQTESERQPVGGADVRLKLEGLASLARDLAATPAESARAAA